MNHYTMRSSVSDIRSAVVCPKPCRFKHPVKPVRYSLGHHADSAGPKSELLDLILPKGGCEVEETSTEAGTSPFLFGSPPSRTSNPLIHDDRFGDDRFSPFKPQPVHIPAPPASPSASSRKGGCVRASFGNSPAVRIEGFNCLDRDRRNCSIPALA